MPDGEPHVFGDRIYIFGSHDIAGGQQYCEGDYVSWSAPLSDPKRWEYKGVSYRKCDDAGNADGKQMWAPDVARGTDGRYYMYYCYAFDPQIKVCVSDRPEGPYQFYGTVKYADPICEGKKVEEHFPFDPAVLTDEDGRVYLYYGFGSEEKMHLPSREELEAAGLLDDPEMAALMEKVSNTRFSPGAMCMELETDMLTAKEEPHMIVPDSIRARGTSFEGHGFFEASSIRKIGDTYYFVYSSQLSHELCYATSSHPDRDFVYGGILISNGDIGLNGNTVPRNTLGNNHGGLECINGDWYVFYHRQTHGTEASRQGCAEKVRIHEDGSIDQAEMTSCGLNRGPLAGSGDYPAAICCNLVSRGTTKEIDYMNMDRSNLAMILEEGNGPEETHIQYIGNINDGTTIGYKYFEMADLLEIRVTIRGKATGKLSVSTDFQFSETAGETDVVIDSQEWGTIAVKVKIDDGKQALFFRYTGDGRLDMKGFELVKKKNRI